MPSEDTSLMGPVVLQLSSFLSFPFLPSLLLSSPHFRLHGNMDDFTVWLGSERGEVIRVFWVNKAASWICRLQQEPSPALRDGTHAE